VLVGSVSASNVVTDIEALQRTLNLRGAQSMIDRLADATEAEPVAIAGYFRRGSRQLMVSEVNLTGVRPATPTTAKPAASDNGQDAWGRTCRRRSELSSDADARRDFRARRWTR
jgi:hypothetical protein